jgi:hypothetical protein
MFFTKFENYYNKIVLENTGNYEDGDDYDDDYNDAEFREDRREMRGAFISRNNEIRIHSDNILRKLNNISSSLADGSVFKKILNEDISVLNQDVRTVNKYHSTLLLQNNLLKVSKDQFDLYYDNNIKPLIDNITYGPVNLYRRSDSIRGIINVTKKPKNMFALEISKEDYDNLRRDGDPNWDNRWVEGRDLQVPFNINQVKNTFLTKELVEAIDSVAVFPGIRYHRIDMRLASKRKVVNKKDNSKGKYIFAYKISVMRTPENKYPYLNAIQYTRENTVRAEIPPAGTHEGWKKADRDAFITDLESREGTPKTLESEYDGPDGMQGWGEEVALRRDLKDVGYLTTDELYDIYESFSKVYMIEILDRQTFLGKSFPSRSNIANSFFKKIASLSRAQEMERFQTFNLLRSFNISNMEAIVSAALGNASDLLTQQAEELEGLRNIDVSNRDAAIKKLQDTLGTILDDNNDTYKANMDLKDTIKNLKNKLKRLREKLKKLRDNQNQINIDTNDVGPIEAIEIKEVERETNGEANKNMEVLIRQIEKFDDTGDLVIKDLNKSLEYMQGIVDNLRKEIQDLKNTQNEPNDKKPTPPILPQNTKQTTYSNWDILNLRYAAIEFIKKVYTYKDFGSSEFSYIDRKTGKKVYRRKAIIEDLTRNFNSRIKYGTAKDLYGYDGPPVTVEAMERAIGDYFNIQSKRNLIYFQNGVLKFGKMNKIVPKKKKSIFGINYRPSWDSYKNMKIGGQNEEETNMNEL